MTGYWPHFFLFVLVAVIWLLELRYYKLIHHIEEHLLITIIASIMAVSFGQVIARYGFNTGWSAALEFNTIMFSWLVLFGMSYGIKTNLHLGVDIVLKALPKRLEKVLSLFGAVCVILYGMILLDSTWLRALGFDVSGGALEYWSKFYKFGIGVDELRYPVWAQELFGLQNRLHKWLVLLALPIGLALLMLRGTQAFVDIAIGKRAALISAHEAEDLVKENKNLLAD
ncbi:MAG: TRAP transporter small permease [Reinekea forsetii]|jgi:C4-dicarboxylate transporter DctQ subunit|uniref:TRAP transporter small permease protein n=1 Tax=Reinekea forsetii TaxID=1336806 RepID=A0A2K8KWG3_9GAMM|nr:MULTISPECIES: TRAP transporter small permease [Reinekea]ATX77464.1 TRAP-type transport system, small permease component, predicted N-acetylneuraminate transporter [Reinekea forsetii]MDB9894326.1 TRAP transporter small permease [Reinekea forsetii]MDO7640609.1 TRAP transporter small permease [Reinekea forsetii]MDO7645658.1 TRAP transporter small permease [Reinekea forsetii]MDO7674050.1 TRAP transporter small permease [Reinekea forsetii]